MNLNTEFNNKHKSVMLKEAINFLNVRDDLCYIDATFGGGGHSRKLLSQLKKGRLIAFDQDLDSLKNIIESKYEKDEKEWREVKNKLKYLER